MEWVGMSRFDEAMEMSVDAETGEMGEEVFLDGVPVMGVVTDIIDDHAQSAGGRRQRVTFSVFVSKVVGEGIVKGAKVEAGGRKGRVLRREDLGGGGFELVCGPVSAWSGDIPGS